eukprot:TRINITY_DN120_c0_g1_i1.p1 TRINITY_DN120_c0_g1~~TRINITY_DN120_c0_g1_i1.p1  ORF type:complete len:488 (+),score=112.32 TRINITY_DN120_c0_g1_i1:59-1522(+)
MAALVSLLSLCISALPSCPAGNDPKCTSMLADGFDSPSAIEVSPDDTLVAVAFQGGLRVHNIATGAAVAVHNSPRYTHLADSSFSSDGASLAVAGVGGVGVLSLSTGQELWFKTDGAYAAVAYSPDGSRIASQLYAGDVHIRNAATGEVLMTLKKGAGRVPAGLHYTPDGSKIICGYSHSMHVWDATTGASLQELSPQSTSGVITISPDGQYLAASFLWEFTCVIYRLSDYTLVHTVSCGFTVGMSFSPDSSEVVMTGGTRSFDFYSVASGTKQRSYPSIGHEKVSFMHNSNGILSVTEKSNGPLLLWDGNKPVGPVQLVSASGTQDVAGVPVAGAEVPLPAGGLALSGVPASLQGSSTAHSTRVAVGEKLRLSCASGSCGFVVAVYACKRCADAANDFEAQMVAAGYDHVTCAPTFSVAGGGASGQYVMRAYHIPVTSNDPVELEAVVHATQHVVAFQLDSAMGVSPPSCPPNVFNGPTPPCLCVQ